MTRRRSGPLSRREREVVQLLVAGLGNKQIARALFMQPNTVKNHLTSIYRVMGVRNRTEAAVHWFAAAD